MEGAERGAIVLVEIRHYTIKPGLRDEFVTWFEEVVKPAMERAGMRILGIFVGVDDHQSFYYLRAFESEEERGRLSASFYQSDEWRRGMRDKALEMEESYEVEVVRSTPGSPI